MILVKPRVKVNLIDFELKFFFGLFFHDTIDRLAIINCIAHLLY